MSCVEFGGSVTEAFFTVGLTWFPEISRKANVPLQGSVVLDKFHWKGASGVNDASLQEMQEKAATITARI